jgi:Enoyl-CoA hydratase/isomerase
VRKVHAVGPMRDNAAMMRNTDAFMSLFRSRRSAICKVHGFAAAGGSDIALGCDIILMAEDARIGYMPARVWDVPRRRWGSIAWDQRRPSECCFRVTRSMGGRRRSWGWCSRRCPLKSSTRKVEALAQRIGSVPQNQLMTQKLMFNGALVNMGLQSAQMMATLFDGIARHTREGRNFKRRGGEEGWEQAVEERDQGALTGSATRRSSQTAKALPASRSTCFSNPPGEGAFRERGDAQATAPVAGLERLDAGARQCVCPRPERLQLHRCRTLRDAVCLGPSQAAGCLC